MVDHKNLSEDMSLNKYQEFANTTAVYPADVALEYLSLGLVAEAGELAGKLAKWYRKDNEFPMDDVIAELGDVLWFVAEMATLLEVSLASVASENVIKLRDRATRGVLQGSGDYR